jgi:hypothetical protein
MKKKFLKTLLVLALFSSNLQAEINEIKVWSPDFQKTHTISDQNQIQLIIKYWSQAETDQKEPIQPLKHEKLYKIDFIGNSKSLSGRWLYNKSGYYRFLSKSPQRTFKVKHAPKLNEQLGI